MAGNGMYPQNRRQQVQVELVQHGERDFVGLVEIPRSLQHDFDGVPDVTELAFERGGQHRWQRAGKGVQVLAGRQFDDRICGEMGGGGDIW